MLVYRNERINTSEWYKRKEGKKGEIGLLQSYVNSQNVNLAINSQLVKTLIWLFTAICIQMCSRRRGAGNNVTILNERMRYFIL